MHSRPARFLNPTVRADDATGDQGSVFRCGRTDLALLRLDCRHETCFAWRWGRRTLHGQPLPDARYDRPTPDAGAGYYGVRSSHSACLRCRHCGVVHAALVKLASGPRLVGIMNAKEIIPQLAANMSAAFKMVWKVIGASNSGDFNLVMKQNRRRMKTKGVHDAEELWHRTLSSLNRLE